LQALAVRAVSANESAMRKHRQLTLYRFGTLLGFAVLSLSAAAQTNFGSVNLGNSESVTVAVPMASAATLSSIAVVTRGTPNLDFTNAGGGSCATGTAYAANASCTVSVTFSPKHVGTRYGAVVLADASGNILGTGYLQGMGAGPQTTFLPATQSANPNSLGAPFSIGVAVDGNGNLYITETANATVQKGTLQLNGSFDWSTIGSGFNLPEAIAVDGAGNVYVIDIRNGTSVALYKETLSGDNYVQSMIASGFSAPIAMVVDGAGNVYVIDQGMDFVTEGIDIPTAVYKEALQPDGSYVQAAIGSGWIFPSSLAVDGAGNVYVIDGGSVEDGGNVPAGVYKETLQPDGSYTQASIGSG
jgi:hypothetical protein